MPPTAYEREIDPDVPLMTKQAPSTEADAMSYSPADDSATVVSANVTAPIMSEADSHHGAALLVRVSQVNGQWLFLIEFIYLSKLYDI
jgi:hypothetical protein